MKRHGNDAERPPKTALRSDPSSLDWQRNGDHVLTAESGPKGLRIAGSRHGPLDLLLSDVVMPGMNGPELASEVARLGTGMRILTAKVRQVLDTRPTCPPYLTRPT